MSTIKQRAIYGRPLTHYSYVFDFHKEIYLERHKLFTIFYGKKYPLWNLASDYLEGYTGKAEEILMEGGNIFYNCTNYDDEVTMLTYHTWGSYLYRSHFHIDLMYKLKKRHLINFRDQVLQPALELVYNDDIPPLRRIALRYGNHGYHRKRYFKS